jgi:hypothetical protein
MLHALKMDDVPDFARVGNTIPRAVREHHGETAPGISFTGEGAVQSFFMRFYQIPGIRRGEEVLI